MKHVKKLLSVILVMIMALTLALPAAAANNGSITIENETEGHQYEVYQIFIGDVSGNVLSNIQWGSAYETEPGIAAPKAAEELSGENGPDAALVGDFLEKYPVEKLYGTLSFADGKYSISNIPTGYYLIKDKDKSQDGGYDAYTQYIVQVVGTVSMKPKSAVPSVDKQVHDEPEDSENGVADGWGETADHAINESFQFKLTATLPADVNFGAYDKYMVKFTDTMSAGVTFEDIASVKVNGNEITAYTYTAKDNQAGGSWTLTIADIKTAGNPEIDLTGGAAVEVIYNAHLNEAAQVNTSSGSTTNKNTVYLEYSNNPNAEGLGKTTEDSVWVFTYRVDNSKVDGKTGAALPGAGFRLYTAVADSGNSDKLVPGKEIPVVATETEGEYRLAVGNESGVDMLTTEETVDGKPVIKNTFSIKGLDAGEYFLKETKTPDGYNTCDPIHIVIKATHVEDKGAASATTTLDATSTMNNIIKNNAGIQLPGTGGIGTTIFYVVGGILVVGAAVLLIAKKRTK